MQTPKAIGLAMAMIAALLVPAAAVSQAKKPAAIPEAARKAGMAQAPAVVQTAGLSCQVSDARLVGEDKKSKTSYYEVACGTGQMGYVLQKPAEGPITSYSCIEANTPPAPGQPPSAPCMLPGNSDPKAVLQPLIKAAGADCVPEQVRGIGQTKTNTYMEVACQGGTGYILLASVPFDGAKPLQAQNCLMYDDAETNIKCTMTDKATRLAAVDKYVTQANNGCVVKDRRFVGVSKDSSTFYEASCQDGKGYIYKVAAAGTLTETYECAKATQILGGCELTDARQAQSEQAGLYTKLVTGAGGKCDVEKYALFPSKAGEEVVELVCKDTTGAILISKAGSKGQVLDCARAPVAGYKCSLSKPEAANSMLTADLKKFNFNSCDVSNSRVVGKTEKGTTYVEVACADKLKGYMIEYQSAPTVSAVGAIGCAFAGNCKLPGNT
ncbi:MAG: hypothetical protein KKE02_16390 [Alphaproteobacteria bacterium]|nr:hypothetical protein [Alphaproteobacteria bacterium]MBU1515328.1 hypothetical protein [Alphaproteobacteria bacterium]MBU2095378.1 hypothetical protein [Alphaproteobacteria bacterium]MBU2152602.1 hypothetical protein [Alphaproteobacteria bacterium]MBU2309998.1 hypothetical protein [Alphaproteobacteria bacterium]